jgi:Cysteine rich repeat
MRSVSALRALLAAALAMAASVAAAAEPPSPQACRADVQKHCAGMQPGGGRIAVCLKQHEAELSAECQAALPVLQRCAQEVQAACASSGRRERRECLRQNAGKLSPECRPRQP